MNTAQDTKQMTGMDLDSLLNMDVAQVTYRVAVIHDEEGNQKSGFIIVGKNSPQFLNSTRQTRVKNVMKSAARRKPLDTATEEGAKILTSTLDDNELNTAVAVVVDWFGWDVEGRPATFDQSTVEKMLTKFPTWRSKVINDLDNDGNFIKA